MLWIGGLVLSLLPADVSFETRPGPPRLVPAAHGLPDPELQEKARRGEVILGGCLATGYGPAWVVVW